MAKQVFDLDTIEDATSDFEPYDGPVPRAGLYTAVLSKAEAKKSKADSEMIEIIVHLTGDENKELKDCPLWVYAVFPDPPNFASAKAKETLNALGITGKGDLETWAKKLNAKKPKCRVRVKNEQYQGNDKASVTQVLPAKSEHPLADGDESPF